MTINSVNFGAIHRTLFEDLFSHIPWDGLKTPYPSNCYVDKDKSVTVQYSLAGFRKDEISVTVEGTTLTINAEKKQDDNPEDRTYRYKHISTATLKDRWNLDPSFDTKNIHVEYVDGILTITVPMKKTKEETPKDIKIH